MMGGQREQAQQAATGVLVRHLHTHKQAGRRSHLQQPLAVLGAVLAHQLPEEVQGRALLRNGRPAAHSRTITLTNEANAVQHVLQ